ncbi:hypothetical protein DRQ07_02830, partial [candidate division KSB1 bacterium]
MNRREFIKRISAGAAFLSFP